MDITRIVGVAALSISLPVIAMMQTKTFAATSTVAVSTSQGQLPSLLGKPLTSTSSASSEVENVMQEKSVGSAAATSLSAEISRLSDQADGVDRLWIGYKGQCGALATSAPAFGREWFVILDEAAPASESPECADFRTLIEQAGKGIRHDLSTALKAARLANVDKATQVGLVRWNSLQLD